jgi:hypothetical protein
VLFAVANVAVQTVKSSFTWSLFALNMAQTTAGHPSIDLNEKDMVDHGERASKASKLTGALQAAQQGRRLSDSWLDISSFFFGALSVSVFVACSTIRTESHMM